MGKTFEIYLASIKWTSIDKVGSFIPSKCPLEYSYELEDRYVFESIMYQKKDGDFCQISVKSKTPVFLNGEELLHKIESTDFWIIKGEWRTSERGTKYHQCPSINTEGSLFFQNGYENFEVQTTNNIDGFDFEALKQEFEGELWNIITSTNSKTFTAKKSIQFGDKAFLFVESQLIIEFVTLFEKIAKNPKSELISEIDFVPAKKVKPVSQTFKQIAKNGESKLLPSRSATQVFDIYENRILCSMLYKINQIVNANIKYTTLHLERLRSEIKKIEMQIELLINDPIVNGEEILQEIKNQEVRYGQWLRKWYANKNQIISVCGSVGCADSFTFEVIYNSTWNWGNEYWGNKDGVYSLVSFPTDMSEIFEEQRSLIVKIKANISYEGKVSVHPKFFVHEIESIELVQINYPSIIQMQKTKYEKLKINNWSLFSILSPLEKSKLENERKSQIKTLEKRIIEIESQIDLLSKFSEEIVSFIPVLKEQLGSHFSKEINLQKLVKFHPSMTFIQNPNYRKAMNIYTQILRAEGIEIRLFDCFEEVRKYCVREMPQVYELWCLVSLIKTLEGTYGLKPVASDLKQLVSNVQPHVKKIERYSRLEFIGDLNGRSIVLHYQKSIDNKRPDFILTISSDAHEINVVLDAKFKNYKTKKSASAEILRLLEKYKIGSNFYVFSIHPNSDLCVSERKIKLTNLGGAQIFSLEGVGEFPNHQYGYMCAKPLDTSNLNKLIAMSLEYLFEINHCAHQQDKSLDPKPENDLICISCGGKEFNMKVNKLITKKGNPKFNYEYQCKNLNCNHTIYVNYCWNCKTKLFKHGSYWDYHRTSVWSIFDIHCPTCGMTVAAMSI